MTDKNGTFALFFDHSKECKNCGNKESKRKENESTKRCTNCSSFM